MESDDNASLAVSFVLNDDYAALAAKVAYETHPIDNTTKPVLQNVRPCHICHAMPLWQWLQESMRVQ